MLIGGTGGDAPENRVDTRESPAKCKEIIQNALNLVNGIAFDSHGHRFEVPQWARVERTPGPGQYEARLPERRAATETVMPIQTTGKDEGRIKFDLGQLGENVGPGSYFREADSLLKHSHNVTLPNNIIFKRKEELVRDKLKIEQQLQ